MNHRLLHRRRTAVFVALSTFCLMIGLAVPAGAAASRAAEPARRVDSFVLPVGAQHGALARKSRAELDKLAAGVDAQAGEPLETVGPAASYAPRATTPSGQPSATAPATVSLPEPSHTMTVAECFKGLGTANKFFVKSRFAVCSGASFTQQWSENNKWTGESAFDAVAIGTIPQNSRVMKVTYAFTAMQTTGTTAAPALQIKTSASIPASWPAKVKYTRTGTALPATRTWAQLQVTGGFSQTVTAAAGQGNSGKTDLIAAVYQPSVTITPAAGWKLGGSTGGQLFMLPPRWDKAPYLSAAKTGAAVFGVIVPLRYSKGTGSPERTVAEHIHTAFTNPKATKPPNALKKVPGQDYDTPLTRLYTDITRRKDNRSVAISACKKYFGAGYAKGGKECDEYPFATTYEGCAQTKYDVHVEKNNYSVKPVAGKDNGNAGILLGQFYAKNRIIDGPDDGFIVQITK